MKSIHICIDGKKMDQRVPELVRPIIENYILEVGNRLPNRLHGFYLVGSIAVGEFNEHFSDIDFIAILNQAASSEEIEKLCSIHQIVERRYPRWKMSGNYIQLHDLGKLEDEIEPHPHYHDGVLHPNVHSSLNSITWWELKNHGIPIVGNAPHDLPFTVDWDLLITKMRENMNSYWAGWTKRPDRILMMYSNWGVQWAILGVLRQFYSFNENSITTKVRAAQYALRHLPDRWHKLIREAIDIRESKKESAYRSRILRMIETVRFLKYVIQLCNTSRPLE